MASLETLQPPSENQVQAEIETLKQSLLPTLTFGTLTAACAWFAYLVVSFQPIGWNALASVMLGMAVVLVHKLRERHYTTACWVLLLSQVAAVTLITLDHPNSLAPLFVTLVILMGHALLSTRAAIALLVVSTGAMSLVLHKTTGTLAGLYGQTITLYALTLGVAWVSGRPVRRSMEWALSGWEEAHRLLVETRERKAEIYRVLRSFEEAMVRIENMNAELIEARRQAEEARAQKARFATTVSHELRGPLNLILGFSRIMALAPERYEEPLPEAYHVDIETIYRSSEHLAALVDDVLDLSLIEAERLPLVRDYVNVEEEIIGRAIAIVQPLAERKGLYLRYEPCPGLLPVLADPVRLRQVLLNLLTNAVRLTERGGIVVSARQDDQEIRVSVHDTGPGISEQDRQGLFREFGQIITESGVALGGSGLGLAICKSLIALHGGRIWVESQLGVGSTFAFSLPLPGTRPLADTLIKTPAALVPSAKRVCLVVHDNANAVWLLARYMEAYHVMGVPNETDLAKLAGDLRPQAILTTPALAAQVVNAVHGMGIIPVIACGLPSADGGLQGIHGYLIKPIAPNALSTLASGLERNGEATILLVDDEVDALRLMERMLTGVPHPYRILKASSGQQALEIMANTRPDMVIIDLLMPGMTGTETIARMRADERLGDVPVVVVSGQDPADSAVRITSPLTIHTGLDLDLATAAKHLSAILDMLSPRYVSSESTA